ncbi:VOC family protein [Kitasatospora sp. NPDC048540]|uniref:VOC family protein n=1 Tax=unclassified Kitasatospora TaxID=2633591 RepID=UPI00053AAD13|nr:VOC family protein [Kitasatospora sp. MBT63]
MDALHPRLLVTRFAETFRFYDAVLPRLVGARLATGGPAGPYAHWDVDGQGVLVLFERAAMAAATGLTAAESPAPGGGAMFVCRVADVDAGLALCLAHGAEEVAPATDRPSWGPTLRTAHLRDPEGTLIELQSY